MRKFKLGKEKLQFLTSYKRKKKKKSLPPSKGKKGFIQTRVTYLRTPLEQEKKQLNKT